MGNVSPGRHAVYGGSSTPDKIPEMTKGKLSYRFGRSLLNNDLGKKANFRLILPFFFSQFGYIHCVWTVFRREGKKACQA
jgi:hypothetical protein